MEISFILFKINQIARRPFSFFFISMILMLIYLRSGAKGIHEIFVRADINCTNCGKTYKRSFWMTNVSNKEYDYCPVCGNKNHINFKDRPWFRSSNLFYLFNEAFLSLLFLETFKNLTRFYT